MNLHTIASMAYKLHAIEQTQSQGQCRVDGLRRLKFDFYTGVDWNVTVNEAPSGLCARAPRLRDRSMT